MNKKITYFLLVLFVATGVMFFVQLNKLGIESRTEVSNLEIPIIVISILAIGVGMAFPALLYKKQIQEYVNIDLDSDDIEQTEIKTNEKFDLVEFENGLNLLKHKSVESNFWYFCEYFKINLGCLYVQQGSTLKVKTTYGIAQTNEDISASQSLASSAIQSGEIEICTNIPSDYFQIHSGLGSISPDKLMFVPIENEGSYILELASFWQYDDQDLKLLKESAKMVLVA